MGSELAPQDSREVDVALPAPYYADDFVTLYHADCRDLAWPIACERTVVVTDPPYGSGLYASDRPVFTASMLIDWLSVSDTTVAVFGWPERLARLCVEASREPDEWVTWWPTNARYRGFNLRGLWREVECIAIFGAGSWARLTQPAAVTTTPMPNRGKRIADRGNRQVRMGDVWRDDSPNLNPNQRGRLHPNEKPVRRRNGVPAMTVGFDYSPSGASKSCLACGTVYDLHGIDLYDQVPSVGDGCELCAPDSEDDESVYLP